MGKLLSDAQLANIQKVAQLGMQTPATIRRRTTTDGLSLSDDDYGSEVSYDELVTLTPVVGMLSSKPTPVAQVDGGALITVNTYMFRVPVGTDIRPGDQCEIAGNTYTVSDTTADQTWPAWLRCSLRLRE